jgi:hypothetical protein
MQHNAPNRQASAPRNATIRRRTHPGVDRAAAVDIGVARTGGGTVEEGKGIAAYVAGAAPAVVDADQLPRTQQPFRKP